MSNSVTNLNKDMTSIASKLGSIVIDATGIIDQEIDMNVVDWYLARFDMLREDNVPTAIPLYLQQLQFRSDVNDITKTYIIKCAYA